MQPRSPSVGFSAALYVGGIIFVPLLLSLHTMALGNVIYEASLLVLISFLCIELFPRWR